MLMMVTMMVMITTMVIGPTHYCSQDHEDQDEGGVNHNEQVENVPNESDGYNDSERTHLLL